MNATTESYVQPLAQADVFLLVAQFLSSPTNVRREDLIVDDSDLETLVDRCGASAPADLACAIRACLDDVLAIDPIEWRGEYTRLFDAAVVCPINETGYIRRDKGAVIADICGFYQAFGFESNETSGEKPDHLVCEFEFAAMLLVMLASARQEGAEERAEITEEALQGFLREHPGEWINLFCQRLEAVAAIPLFQHLPRLIELAWNMAAESLRLPTFDDLQSTWDWGATDDEETPYECGMAEADQDQEQEQVVSLTGPPGSDLPQLDQ